MSAPADTEIELKLHVPADRVAAVEAALSDRTRAHTVHLRAAYFDTADHHLAKAGLAWRVRREGNRWVQTLKGHAPESDGMEREEHNVVQHGRSWPAPDATLFAGTHAGEQLLAVLADLEAEGSAPPAERFRTDIRRLERTQKVKGGTVVFAFDRGTVAAPNGRSAEVCELEIELGSGSATAVLDTARKWTQRHDLWIDVVNKAMRGSLVADAATTVPVAKGVKPRLTADMSADAALREITGTCLGQILRNTSALANEMATPEHVHMARVGMRKLRSILREMGHLSPAVDPAWADGLGVFFGRLGAARDRDVLADLLPALAAAGAPEFTVPDSAGADAGAVVRDPAFTLLVLDLMQYAHGAPLPAEDGTESLTAVVAEELRRLHRRTLRDHRAFPSLPEAEQHEVRKRLKRLRYTAELTASLFPARQVRSYVRALAPAQDALGHLNDLVVARDTFAALGAAGTAEAWFAAGWAAAQIPAAAAACAKPLAAAADAPRHWRKVGARTARR